MKNSYQYDLDGIEFELAENIDIAFIEKLGTIVYAYDQNDSGNLAFVVKTAQGKIFVKIAGVATINSNISKSDAIINLRKANQIYRIIKHENLISPIHYWEDDSYAYLAFPFVEGDCLYDHWNFEEYKRKNQLSPLEKFRLLDAREKLRVIDALFSFFITVNKLGYLAIDFYEGSMIYNFSNGQFYFCDIDFFTKYTCVNLAGTQWGASRFLSYEEKTYGCLLNEATDVYHMGVFLSVFFGENEKTWELSGHRYYVMKKAVSQYPKDRYACMQEFYNDWSS